MTNPLPDFKTKAAMDQKALGTERTQRMVEAGRSWNLAGILAHGGAILFPHATIDVCGEQIAAAVTACMDCGAERVVALGVIHALNEDLRSARRRVAEGGDPDAESLRGIQGPGLPGREEWRKEFSLDHFCFLWEAASRKYSGHIPELILRYPFLSAGHPETLPGIVELCEISRGAAVVATADPFHHGIAYGDEPTEAFSPESGGLELARGAIETGLALLESGDHPGFERHCNVARSDARDTGQVLRHLCGPMRGEILDLIADDVTRSYGAAAPSWVAGALIALEPDYAQKSGGP